MSRSNFSEDFKRDAVRQITRVALRFLRDFGHPALTAEKQKKVVKQTLINQARDGLPSGYRRRPAKVLIETLAVHY